MRCRWSDLPEKFITTVIRRLKSFSHLSIQTVVTFYNAFSKLECRYRELHPSVRDTLELNFVKSSAQDIKPHEIGVFIYSVAKLNADWNDFSEEMQSAAIGALEKHSYRLNEQELGNVIWGLGHMKVDLNLMTTNFRESIFKPIVRKANELRDPALVAILQGIGRGQLQWNKLHPQLKGALLRSAYIRLLHHPDLNFVITLLQAMGRLSAEWYSLPAKLTNAFLDTVRKGDIVDVPSSRIASLLNGLACMSVTWSLLDAVTKDQLLRAIQAKAMEFSRTEVSSVLWSLGRMGAKTGIALKDELWMLLRQCLQVHVAEMTAAELAWTLWALGKLEAQFSEMDDGLQSRILQATSRRMIYMNSRERGVTFWAMARLSIPINELSMDDRNAIVQTIQELAMQSLSRSKNDSENGTS